MISNRFSRILDAGNKPLEDIQRGNTGVGCHRDDINFELNGMDVKIFGSQGQQRTVVLSLKRRILN